MLFPLLLGGGLFLGIFYNLSIWYKLTDKTRYGAIISVIGAISTFSLNWILIPMYGYMGSAVATFASYLIMTIISYLWGKHHYPVPYQLWKILGYILLAGVGIVVNYRWQEYPVVALVIIGIFLTLSILFERNNLKNLSGTE